MRMARIHHISAALTLALAVFFGAHGTHAATLNQTVHFPQATADALFELFATGAGQARITGIPAHFAGPDGGEVARAETGSVLRAFCFQPEHCALVARVLEVSRDPGVSTLVMSWWNFGWVSADDPGDTSNPETGAPNSILVLTFRDTATGAQIELVQANVPDYRVSIPSPDGSVETGPLSRIVNTHWHTLYWDGVRRLLSE